MDIHIDLIEKQIVIKENITTKGDINIKDTNEKNKVERNLIKPFDFFSINNIKITEKIKKNPYFFLQFDLFLHYNFIKIGELSEKYLQHNITKTSTNNKYILFTYKKIKHIDLDNFLLHLPRPKLFVFHIIDSFSKLLKSLLLLHEKKICFFNVSTKNIVFDKGFNPILRDFSTSLLLNNLDEAYLSQIIEKTEDYTLKPLETHVLFYLINNEEHTLSYSSVVSICDYFVENNPILDLFSEQYREKYNQTCVEVLKKYINKSRSEIISDIIKYSLTWDNYSFSILYLFFIGNFIKCFSLKECFLSKFSILLNKNIHPDPLKRENMNTTQLEFQKLFHEFVDWDFADNLSVEKYKLYLKMIKK